MWAIDGCQNKNYVRIVLFFVVENLLPEQPYSSYVLWNVSNRYQGKIEKSHIFVFSVSSSFTILIPYRSQAYLFTAFWDNRALRLYCGLLVVREGRRQKSFIHWSHIEVTVTYSTTHTFASTLSEYTLSAIKLNATGSTLKLNHYIVTLLWIKKVIIFACLVFRLFYDNYTRRGNFPYIALCLASEIILVIVPSWINISVSFTKS